MNLSIAKDLNKIKKILFLGYGNPGRKDDGLGIKFVDLLEKWANKNGINNVDFDSNYQLNIEDAYTITHYDMVILIDASMEDMNGFSITEVKPSDKVNFSTHTVSPSFLAHLCREIYQKVPEMYLIHIKGYKWDLEEGLSKRANINLQEALSEIQKLLQEFAETTAKNTSLLKV